MAIENGAPPDPRKQICNELAELLGQEEGVRVVRLLQHLELCGPAARDDGAPAPASPAATSATPADTAAETRPAPIGIWEPQETRGELAFVRPEPTLLGDGSAQRRVLLPKRSALPGRICFFGESAAAGFFYAPHLTPAQLLQEQLRVVKGPGQYEVVDLARVNESILPLLDTVQAACQLKPDLLVVFAGNNWNLLDIPTVSPQFPSVDTRQEIAESLRASGLRGPAALADARLKNAVESALARLGRIANAAQIPVVVVVPEVNLADWENRQPVMWLPEVPGGGIARWYELYGAAKERLAGGRWDEAAALAARMIELDLGTCSTSHRLLARAEIGRGRMAEALAACRAEVDATRYSTLCFMASPQCTGPVREALLRGARQRGFGVVDLAAVFAEHTGSPLPGRRMFMDYCHLTVEGMKVAMAAVTAEILRLGGGAVAPAPDWRQLVKSLPNPQVAPEVDATAKLGAALHNAHRQLAVGNRDDIVEHWCERALAASPGIAEAMVELLAARSTPCPAVLTAAQQRIWGTPYRLTLYHGWRSDSLDAPVFEVVGKLLARSGRQSGEASAALLVERQRVGRDAMELAYPAYYHWDPIERFYPDVVRIPNLTQRALYRSPWPVSSFCLVADGVADVELDLTARLPGEGRPRQGTVTVAVNGRPVGELAAGERWSRARFRVQGQALSAGLNRVTLHWPLTVTDGDTALAQVIARLEQGIAADLHPVFGEVFSLRVQPR